MKICNYRYLLTGNHSKPLEAQDFYKTSEIYDLVGGNLFDGDTEYYMLGFPRDVMVITSMTTKKIKKSDKFY